MSQTRKSRTMYMHTLDRRPASYCDMHGHQFLAYAAEGHRSRAAQLVASRRQIHREQQACIAAEWKDFNACGNPKPERPSAARYGYVLVEVQPHV